jgi:DNA-binding NtrC family response regulator
VTIAWKETGVKSRSVVIIDDEKPYVESMAKLIGDSLDCPVHPFTSAADALARLEDVSAAVVVTDYSMPDMDGLEFIGEAAKIAPGTSFILISGHDLDGNEGHMSQLKGLKICLQKPVGSSSLVAAILKAWPGNDAPASRS